MSFRNMRSVNPSAMARTPAAMPREETVIKLKAVTPRFPESKEEALQLNEDLERMGCTQLRHRPWGLKSVHMLRKLKTGAPNQFVGTLRAKPNMWTTVTWRKTYGFGPDGKGFCARNQDFTPGRFFRSGLQ